MVVANKESYLTFDLANGVSPHVIVIMIFLPYADPMAI